MFHATCPCSLLRMSVFVASVQLRPGEAEDESGRRCYMNAPTVFIVKQTPLFKSWIHFFSPPLLIVAETHKGLILIAGRDGWSRPLNELLYCSGALRPGSVRPRL